MEPKKINEKPTGIKIGEKNGPKICECNLACNCSLNDGQDLWNAYVCALPMLIVGISTIE